MGRGKGNLSLSVCSEGDFGVFRILSCTTVPVYGDVSPSPGAAGWGFCGWVWLGCATAPLPDPVLQHMCLPGPKGQWLSEVTASTEGSVNVAQHQGSVTS